MDVASLAVAFSLGILGGVHCIGMCGGIIGALSMATRADQHRKRFFLIVTYNIGRIASYLVVASGFYTLTSFAQSYFNLQIMRVVASLLLIAMGLYLANWWRGLTKLEALGHFLWRYIQPFSQRLLPVKTQWQAFCLGLLWGWLPCGLIYSALAYSSTASSLPMAVLIMLCFALGTLPAVMASGLIAERLAFLVKQPHLRIFFALTIIVYGCWSLLSAIMHSH